MGKTYDFQITYEHSALAAYKADATNTYRYVKLPDDVSLAEPEKNRRYKAAGITIPGLRLPYGPPTVRIPGMGAYRFENCPQ